MVRSAADAQREGEGEDASEAEDGEEDDEEEDEQGAITWRILEESPGMALPTFEQGWCAFFATLPCSTSSFAVGDFNLSSEMLPHLCDADIKVFSGKLQC